MKNDTEAAELSRPEVHDLMVSWLTTTPEMSFARARKDAAKMGMKLTPRLFAEAKRSLGMSAGPPRAMVRKGTEAVPGAPRARTPLMAFVIDYLQGHPESEFKEVRTAGEAAGFKVAPVVYGKARNLLGLGGGTTRPRRRREAEDGFEAGGASGSMDLSEGLAPLPRRRRMKPLNLDSLGSLVGELQGVIEERDRALKALHEIHKVLQRFFAPPPSAMAAPSGESETP